LADRYVFILNFIAELDIFRAPRLRFGTIVRCVIEIELHSATIYSPRQHAVGLQAAGQDIEHRVRIEEVVERLAAAVKIIAAFQWTELERIPFGRFGDIAAIVEQTVQARMDVRYVISLQVIVHVNLPITGHVVAGTMVEFIAFQRAMRTQSCVDASNKIVERRARRRWRRTQGLAIPARGLQEGAHRRD
jgi:hypothetical protein